MPAITELSAPLQRLSPATGQYFFGYYDIPAADPTGRHLCHQVQFRDRYPTPEDAARLGLLQVPAAGDQEPVFTEFGETIAWNFQQGSMLQWLPTQPDWCLYNTFREGSFGCCLHNVITGQQRHLPRAVANVALDGSRALCVNMPRIYDFRPGYGYEELQDPYTDVPAPEEDGVSVMDLSSGDSRMVLSLAEAVDFLAAAGEDIRGQKVVINHITFNPAADRYLFLLRSFPEPGKRWCTWLVTAATDGGDLRHRNAFGIASHYYWRNDREMLFYMKPEAGDKLELILVDDETDERTLVDPGYFLDDGHCSYSPDGRWLLYDSYPDSSTPDYARALFLYDLERRTGMTLGRFRSERLIDGFHDLRCDLHPRWLPDGQGITFDSIHEGFRGVYYMDLSAIVG